ncbi:MAG: hypothetical protein GYA62_03280 [Bacteroidales bacterium]|nr:hypothetical protein [Bacteroidales bacterium]
MKKNLSIFFLTLLIIIPFSLANAQTKNETDINLIYNKSFKLFNSLYSNKPLKDNKLAIYLFDYGVEIVKKAPKSIEAYIFITHFRKAAFPISLEYSDKLNELKNKYLKEIDKFDNEIAEKFILILALISTNIMEINPWYSEKDLENFNIANEALIKLANHKQTDYAILAQIAISPGYDDTKIKDEIITKYPNHPFIPLVKLSKTDSYLIYNNYDEAINYAIKLSQEYKDVKMPEGYDFKVECYHTVCTGYLEKNDIENAEKYLKLIEQLTHKSKIAIETRKKFELTIAAINKAQKLENDIENAKRNLKYIEDLSPKSKRAKEARRKYEILQKMRVHKLVDMGPKISFTNLLKPSEEARKRGIEHGDISIEP